MSKKPLKTSTFKHLIGTLRTDNRGLEYRVKKVAFHGGGEFDRACVSVEGRVTGANLPEGMPSRNPSGGSWYGAYASERFYEVPDDLPEAPAPGPEIIMPSEVGPETRCAFTACEDAATHVGLDDNDEAYPVCEFDSYNGRFVGVWLLVNDNRYQAVISEAASEAGFVESEVQPEEAVTVADLMPSDEVRITSRNRIVRGTVDSVGDTKDAWGRVTVHLVEEGSTQITKIYLRPERQAVRLVDRASV